MRADVTTENYLLKTDNTKLVDVSTDKYKVTISETVEGDTKVSVFRKENRQSLLSRWVEIFYKGP